mgnify:CR=1 FL=1
MTERCASCNRILTAQNAYETINDAADRLGDRGYEEGLTEIWYVKPQYSRDYRMGMDWLYEETPELLPESPRDLAETHQYLGSIRENDLEEVFVMMQGREWSPKGEARELIKDRGLAHTSMSVGDAIVQANDIYLVDNVGFEKVS